MEEAETPQEQPEESFEGVAIAEKPQKDWTKIILFSLLGLLVISGVVYATYWYAARTVEKLAVEVPSAPGGPTPSLEEQTKDWKTYTNTEYGFELKYPDSWTINKDSYAFKEGGDLFSIYIWGETQKTGTELYDGASLTIGSVIKTDKDIKSWVREYYGEKSIVYDTPNEFSQETINGLLFQKVTNSVRKGLVYYNIKKDDYVYRIVASAFGPDEKEYKRTVNQILSTFKFLD